MRVQRTIRVKRSNLAIRTNNLCNLERGIVLDLRRFRENKDIQAERNIALYQRLEMENQAALEKSSCQEPEWGGQSVDTREKFVPSKAAVAKWGGNYSSNLININEIVPVHKKKSICTQP